MQLTGTLLEVGGIRGTLKSEEDTAFGVVIPLISIPTDRYAVIATMNGLAT